MHTARLLLLAALAGLFCLAGPAGASHAVTGTPVVTRLMLPTSDLVFDPLSNRLYASVPSGAGTFGNRVVALDPASGGVVASAFVGSEPGKLAVSADGQYLYVALDGAAAVRRVALPSLTPGLQFALGSTASNGPLFVEDLEVSPDDAGVLAVSRRNVGFSQRHEGVAIYDDGVKLPDETSRFGISNVIEFGSSASRLYGYNSEISEFGFRRMTVGPSGVSSVDATRGLIPNPGDIEFDAGRIYATTGRVIDPEGLSVLGTFPFPSAGPVEPDTAHGRVFELSGATLGEYDPSTFTLRQSYPVAGISGTPASLVGIGGSDLAFRTSADQVFLVHFRDAADTTPPTLSLPGDLAVDATGSAGAAVTYTASATDDVDGALPASCVPGSGSVFPIGRSRVVCTATDHAGNAAAGSFAVTVSGPQPTVVQVGLATNDLAYDPFSQKLYASTPAGDVVAIDPASGGVTGSAPVGGAAGKLALSADGTSLYVALTGASAVRRVSLPSLKPGLAFALGSDPFAGPYEVQDMEVLPTDPGAVAVSRTRAGVSPRHGGVAIYEEGVKLPNQTPDHTGSNVIEFGASASRLYGQNTETSEFGFRRMAVDADGVTVQDVTQQLINGSPDIEFDAGRIYATGGRTIDPEARTLLATFPFGSNGLIEPDTAHGKLFHLNGGTLSEFDSSTFTLRQLYVISGISGTPSSLVQMARSDLAFRTSANQVFLVHFPASGDVTSPVLSLPGDLTVDATRRLGVRVSYTASATDETDGAVPVTCSRASDSRFPIGTRIVTCSATDVAGNVAVGAFRVRVLGADEQITSLLADVQTLTNEALRQSLGAMLADAAAALDSDLASRACSKLQQFLREVRLRSGSKIPASTASEWIVDAKRIRAVIGC